MALRLLARVIAELFVSALVELVAARQWSIIFNSQLRTGADKWPGYFLEPNQCPGGTNVEPLRMSATEREA